jgi:putative ABC transport system substrate-binding protein
MSLEVRAPTHLEGAFQAVRKERAGALIVLTDRLILGRALAIADLATKHRLPTMYGSRWFVEGGGGLMAYGPSTLDLGRRLASYVDRILKGAKPADLPVEEPTRFELVINLRTAKALGLTIPQSLLLRADHVIE